MLKLDNLDEAVKLRNYRNNAMRLKQRAFSGYFDPIIDAGCAAAEIRVSTVIPIDALRQAINDQCDKDIASYDSQLAAIGVEP